jgi:CheY-like chemotaxis protein
MPTRVMLFNGNAVTQEFVSLALPSPMFGIYVVADVPEAIRALHSASKRVVVIIDYPVTSWQISAQFIEAAAQDDELVHRHTYVLMLSTDETLPLHISKALNKLSSILIAKPASKEQILSIVQIMAQRQPLGHTSSDS